MCFGKTKGIGSNEKNKLIVNLSFFLVFLLALGLRVHHLDYESLYMDELRQVSYYKNSLVEIVFNAASQQQPPLDYWIGHFFHRVSSSDFSARLPSALFGAGSVLLITLLLNGLCSWAIALGTGIIMSLLPFNLYFSQEARPYSIAIFFFLAVLFSLNRLFGKEGSDKASLLLLFGSTVCFLYSRTLSPLVTIISLVAILMVRYLYISVKSGFSTKRIQGRILSAILILMVSVFIYLPVLRIILSSGSRYASDPTHFGITTILNGIRNFTLFPLWRAYITQLEPIGWVILPFLFIVPYLAFRTERWKESDFLNNCLILLFTAALLNIFIFKAKSTLPFRPPYAIYILPLALILSAGAFHAIYEMLNKKAGLRLVKFCLIILFSLILIISFNSAILFKKTRKKTDWRGLCRYLTKAYGPQNIIYFDSLSPFGLWEPTFYGFAHYYRGKSILIPVAEVPYIASKLKHLVHEPVLVLFQWRDYKLTPKSKYPFFSRPSPSMPSIDYSLLKKDPSFRVTTFTGFSVIKLKSPSGNLARDSYNIFKRLISDLPDDSSIVELKLAGMSLARVLGIQMDESYLSSIVRQTPENHKKTVEGIIESLRTY